jgi:trehalose 6-phosphate synthase/phosphatase
MRGFARGVSGQGGSANDLALWPLFHYLLWLDSTATVPSPDPLWTAYHKANTLFSDKVAEIYRPGDLIMVHDYHLLLAPKMIRDTLSQGSTASGGFATATPSPAIGNEKRKGMDWENDGEEKSKLEKLGGLLGNVGASLGQHLGLGENKESVEIMIGMFMHTPWPSSEIFRCLPSES